MEAGLGNQLAHGHPGTPVNDLFPLGSALLGDGNRSSLRPIRAGELRSHSAVLNKSWNNNSGLHQGPQTCTNLQLEDL